VAAGIWAAPYTVGPMQLTKGAARLTALPALLLVLWAGCAPPTGTVPSRAPTASPAAAAALDSLVKAMGQRLALMPQVAEWKRARNRPVRDRPRELQVLDQAVAAMDSAARKAGVEPLPEAEVRRFYQAQIEAAVAIQERILSKPANRATEVPDLKLELRPELDRLGAMIADLLVAQPEPPERTRLDRLAKRYWQVEGLDADATSRLLEALERLLGASRRDRSAEDGRPSG
jgi:chorismate mutase-like protein